MNKPESLCDRCDKYASCLLNYDGPACRRNRTTQPTNADRIRAMSDEELAYGFARYFSCEFCRFEESCGACKRTYSECVNGWLEWLKKEADT